MIIMSLIKLVSVRLLTAYASLLLSACSLPLSLQNDSVIRYNNGEIKPDYRSGQVYMPVAYQGKMTWVARQFQDRVSNDLLLDVWIGSQGRIIRTHNDGKVVEVVGYGEKVSRLIDDCPAITELYTISSKITCKRTYLTERQGQYKLKMDITISPAIPAILTFGDKKQEGLIVREDISASTRTGNFYFYSLQGIYVMSRQWLDAGHYIDVYAMEKSE